MATLEDLGHELDEVPLESVRQMRELLSARARSGRARRLSSKRRSGRPPRAAAASPLPAWAAARRRRRVRWRARASAMRTCPKSRGMAIGVAPDGARPAGGLVEQPRQSTKIKAGDDAPASPGGAADGDAPPGRAEAYTQFKAAEGLEVNTALLTAKAAYKSARQARADGAAKVNAAKAKIDEVKAQLDAKKRNASRPTGTRRPRRRRSSTKRSLRTSRRWRRRRELQGEPRGDARGGGGDGGRRARGGLAAAAACLDV